MPKKKKNDESKNPSEPKSKSPRKKKTIPSEFESHIFETREKEESLNWEPNLSKKGLRKLAEDYETMDLLGAVDSLDAIRYLTGDQGINMPPQLRFDLMELHSLMFRLLREGGKLSKKEKEKLFDLIESTEDDIYTIIENAEKIMKILRPLYELFGDPDNPKDNASGLEDLNDED